MSMADHLASCKIGVLRAGWGLRDTQLMDMETLVEAAGITVSTLTAWQNRALIRGYVAKGPGTRQEYDVEVAAFVGIMASLSRLGVGRVPAAGIAARFFSKEENERGNYVLLTFEEPYALDSEVAFINRKLSKEVQKSLHRVPATHWFEDMKQLPDVLALIFPRRLPGAYVVLNIQAIRDLMHAVEADWQRRKGQRQFDRRRRAKWCVLNADGVVGEFETKEAAEEAARNLSSAPGDFIVAFGRSTQRPRNNS